MSNFIESAIGVVISMLILTGVFVAVASLV